MRHHKREVVCLDTTSPPLHPVWPTLTLHPPGNDSSPTSPPLAGSGSPSAWTRLQPLFTPSCLLWPSVGLDTTPVPLHPLLADFGSPSAWTRLQSLFTPFLPTLAPRPPGHDSSPSSSPLACSGSPSAWTRLAGVIMIRKLGAESSGQISGNTPL
jgi:hypothetical protein